MVNGSWYIALSENEKYKLWAIEIYPFGFCVVSDLYVKDLHFSSYFRAFYKFYNKPRFELPGAKFVLSVPEASKSKWWMKATRWHQKTSFPQTPAVTERQEDLRWRSEDTATRSSSCRTECVFVCWWYRSRSRTCHQLICIRWWFSLLSHREESTRHFPCS